MSARFKVKNSDSKLVIKCKLDKGESINQRDIDVLNAKVIRGLMKPTVEGNRKISYLSPAGVSLADYLSSGITQNDFFLVFAQILEVVKSVNRNSFNINNLVMNLKYTFINLQTKEVHFIYQPIISQTASSSLAYFVYDAAYNTHLTLNEDNRIINDFLMYIRSLKFVSVLPLENYILNVYPQIYNQVKRQKPGQSEIIEGADVYYRRNEWEQRKQEAYDEEATSVIVDEEQTSLLVDDGEETSLLDDSENATSLLSENPECQNFPYLIRKNTYDRIEINKPVFRIGKEKSYVDYFIGDNNTISRLHADILNESGKYFLKDNNSTNHSYVNGKMLLEHQLAELSDGAIITLSNENFEFHI